MRQQLLARPRDRSRSDRLASTAVFLLAAFGVAAEDRPSGPARGQIEVAITNLDVVVVRKGDRVAGLTAADFEVKEDGRVQKISNFSEVREGRLAPAAVPAAEASADVPRDAATDAATPAPAPPAHLLLFIDDARLTPQARNRVLEKAVALVTAAMDGTVDASVVSWDRALRVRQPFTRQPASVVAALKSAGERAPSGVTRAAEKREVLQRIDEAFQNGGNPRPIVQAYAGEMETRQRGTLGALRAAAATLSGVEGRKALVCVTDGLDQTPGVDVWAYLDDLQKGTGSYLEARQYDLTDIYREVVRTANAGGVSFYVIDAAGLATDPSVDSISAKTLGRLDAGLDRFNRQSMMKSISEETGGFAITDTNDPGPLLARLEQDLTSYYSIGYPTPPGPVDRERKISVRCLREGLVARARRTLTTVSAATRIAEGVRSALFVPRAENPLEITLLTAPSPSSSGDERSVPIRVRGPWTRIAPPDGPGDWRLTVYAAAMDDHGRETDLTTRSLPVTRDAPGDVYHADLILRFRSGRYLLSIAVRDEAGGNVSYLQTPLTVR